MCRVDDSPPLWQVGCLDDPPENAETEQHTQQSTRWAVCVKTQSGWGKLGAYTICLVLADKAAAERTVAACCKLFPGGYVVQEMTGWLTQ